MRLAKQLVAFMRVIVFTVIAGSAVTYAAAKAAEIENIAVTATRTERELKDVPVTVSIINAEDVEKNLSRDIRDLIRYEPGVSVSGGGRFGLSGFTIRGIGGDRVLTQVDGVPAVDEFSFGPFLSARRDFVDVDALKTVEIIRGPASSLYGSDALGGVVSFLTKDPDDYLKTVDRPWYLSAKSGYTSEDNGFLTTATLAGGRDTFKGLLLYTWRDGEETENNHGGGDTDTGPAREEADPQDYDSHNVLAKLVYDLNESHRFRFTTEYYRNDTRSDVLSESGVSSRGILTLASKADDIRERHRFALSHEYDGDTMLFNRSKWKLYFQDSESRQETEQERVSRGTPQLRSRNSIFNQDIFGIELQLDKSIMLGETGHHFIYGFEYEATDSESIREGATFHGITGVELPEFSTFPTRGFPPSETTEYAFFLQDEIALAGGRFLLTPGIRYDRYELDPDANDNVFFDGNRGVLAPEKFADDQVSFKVGAVFHINDTYSLYGGFSQGFRSPPYDDINIGFTNLIFGYTAVSNLDLEPESSDSYEAGIKGEGQHGSFSLAFFLNQYDNFIDSRVLKGFNPRIRLLEFQSINREEVEVKGIEFKGDWDVEASFPGLKGFRAYASLAWSHGQDEQADQPLNTIDPMKGVFGLAWQPNQSWRTELVLTAVSRKKRIDNITAQNRFFATPGFVTLDLLGEYRFNEHAYVNAGVFNLTDKKYWDWGDMIGREQDDVALNRFSRPGINASVSFRYVF